MNESLRMLRGELPGLQEAVPLASLCTYGVGGPAEYLFRATTTSALVHAITTARALGLPLTVLGRGTNILVSDEGIRGLTVLARNEAFTLEGDVLSVEAGAELLHLVAALAERGLGGLEFAGNIPGSVGGAIVGNAGAYGRAVGDALLTAHLLEGSSERIAERDELDFGYRSSALKRSPELVVLSARFLLTPGDREALQRELARDAELRRGKHPRDCGSCGSFFKNPSRELPAARLIEEAGLKGLTVRGAQVSPLHANFLVTLPGATAADVVALAEEVRRRVHETSGHVLEEEVRRLGFA